MSVPVPSRSTLERIERLMGRLDYGLLGEIYCEEGGQEFWRVKRGEVVELGREWARASGQRLAGAGRSLYAGAGVGELPVILTEVLDLGREVVVASLRAEECAVLNGALAAEGLGDRVEYRCRDAGGVADLGPFDHLCAVSVLDDPETFPLVSDVTYGRRHPVSLDPEEFAGERQRVRALVDGMWKGMRKPFLITTTAEEVPWFMERAERDGSVVDADDELIETAIVGDPLGFLVVRGP